jgi:hypothetical protein
MQKKAAVPEILIPVFLRTSLRSDCSEPVLFLMMRPNPPDNSAESFIAEHLSIYQARWLRSQSAALGQTRTEILDAILKEWFAQNPTTTWKGMDEGEIARLAVGQFILRHYGEFLPVSCGQ